MTNLGLSTAELVTLLMIGLGPIRVSLVFLSLAEALPEAERRFLVRRTVALGVVVAVLVAVLGGAVVRNFAPRPQIVVIGAGLVLVTTALTALVRSGPPPSPAPGPSGRAELAAFALTPLAVPGMIGPVGFLLLFCAAAYPHGVGESVRVIALVLAVLALNFVTLSLVFRVVAGISRPVLVVLQYMLNLLTVALGVRLVLDGLAAAGVIALT